MNMSDFMPLPGDQLRTIFRRAEALYGYKIDRLQLSMDLAAVNAHTPLDGKRLAAFPDVDFLHDIGGITAHIDRETGRLTECFVPRCSR